MRRGKQTAAVARTRREAAALGRLPWTACAPTAVQLCAMGGLLCVLGLLSYPLPVAWLSLAGLAALATARVAVRGHPVPRTAFNLPIFLYVAGALVGLLGTVRGWHFAEIRFFGLLAAVAAFYLLVDLVASARTARLVLLACLLLTVLALPPLLLLTAPALQVSRLPEPLAQVLSAAVPLGEPWRSRLLQDETFHQRFRVYGSGLGTLALWGGALALGPALHGASPRERFLGVLAGCYCGLFVLLSASRGTLLSAGALVTLVACIQLARPHRWRLAVAGLLVAATAGTAALLAASRLASGPGPTWTFLWAATDLGPLYARLEMWRNTLFLMGDFFFTGVGLGLRSSAAVYRDYFLPIEPGFAHAHSSFLQSYLEQGILGLVGLLGLLGVACAGACRLRVGSQDAAYRSVVVAASGATLVLVLRDLTDILAMTTIGMVLLFGALGLLAIVFRLTADQDRASQTHCTSVSPHRQGQSRRKLLLISLGAACLALLSLAHPGLRGLLPPELKQAGRPVIARIYLNFGLLEVSKARFAGDHLAGRHLERAEPLLERAAQFDPGNLAVERGLAAAAVARSRPAEAQRLLENLSGRLAPGDAALWFQIGRLYRQAGNVEGAIGAWSRITVPVQAWSCSSPEIQLVRWGIDLDSQGRSEQAAQVYRAAIEIRPTDPSAYRLLSNAALVSAIEKYRPWGHFVAREYMQALTREYPDVPWGYLEVGWFYEQSGRWFQARDWTRKAARVATSPEWGALDHRFRRVRSCEGFLLPSPPSNR